MKLIFCPKCSDVVKLSNERKYRWCKCRASGGRYKKDNLNAIVTGSAVPIGLCNNSLFDQLTKWLENPNEHTQIDTWIFCDSASTIENKASKEDAGTYVKAVKEMRQRRNENRLTELFAHIAINGEES